MSLDIRLSNFPKLIDASYSWFMDKYTVQPVVYSQLMDMRRPADFNDMLPYYRGVPGVLDVTMNERDDGEPVKFASGGFEDYYFLMKRRQHATGVVIPPDVIRAGENSIVNFIQAFVSEFAVEAARVKDSHCADLLIGGPLTAGHVAFNNSLPNYADPYPLFIYDSLPYFDTAHPQSSKVTGTTYINHTASLSFSRTNLKTVYTTMSKTNAKDRNGKNIVIQPNTIVAPPDLMFTIERELGAGYEDADLQPNVVAAQANWKRIYNRYLSDTDGWYVFETMPGGGCQDMLFIDDWNAPEIRIWYDEERKVNKISGEISFGSVIRDWRHSYCCNVAAA